MRSQHERGYSARGTSITAMFAAVALGAALVAAQLAPAFAQGPDAVSPAQLAREGYTLTRNDAENIESLLKSRPDDLAARTRLLGFYFRGATRDYPLEIRIEARRRHILWLIENRPEADASALSEATIDARGHVLADPAGFDQASTKWMEQAGRHATDVRVLGHAANFFRLSDKERAVSLLRQAQAVQPDRRGWSASIGYVYALGILGVDMVNQNGLPTSHNAAEARNAFASRAIEELKASSDAALLGVAGRIVGQYGLILGVVARGPDKFVVDHAALSEAFLTRAQQLEPANPQWVSDLEELRKLWSIPKPSR